MGRFRRRPSGQHRQAIKRRRPLGLKAGQRRARLFEQRARLPRLQPRRATALEQAPGQVKRALLNADRLLRDRQLAIERADIGIGARRLRCDGDAREVERGLHRVGIGVGRADRTADPTEQVDLVSHVQPDIIAFALDRTEAAGRGPRLTRIARAGRNVGGGQSPRPRFLQHRARLPQIGGGHAQVGIRRQRLFDQRVERGVAEQAPPFARRLVAGEGGRLALFQKRVLRGRRRFGRHIGRTDRAGAERERAGGEHQGADHREVSGVGPPSGAAPLSLLSLLSSGSLIDACAVPP